jgi:glycosyltransferase involved in cell wall biosynthesis
MNARLSFVIPCFNQAQYLREALHSLQRQTVPAWEAVVVDDCSTAGDPEAVVKATADERVRFLRHAVNRGLAAARNTAVGAARTELIMPLDADDRLAPEFLARNLEAFADEAVGFVYTDVLLFGAGTGCWHYGPFESAEIGRRQPLCGCSAFRLRAWKDVGGYCENPVIPMGNEDWDFWLGVVAKGYRGRHIPLPLYEYRQVPGSMARRLKPELWKTHEFYFQRHREFLEKHHVADAFLRVGYEESVWALVGRGDYRAAIPLAAKARAHGSREPAIRGLAKLAAAPAWALPPCFAALMLPAHWRRIRANGLGVRSRVRRLLGHARKAALPSA